MNLFDIKTGFQSIMCYSELVDLVMADLTAITMCSCHHGCHSGHFEGSLDMVYNNFLFLNFTFNPFIPMFVFMA